jgi:membrane-associated protease RseP (regulator of RpoE activity)
MLSIVMTLLGFPFMLGFLVLVHRVVQSITRRALGVRDTTAPLPRRLLAAAAGALASYLACALLFLVAIVGLGRPEATLRVAVMRPGPAYEAGLRDGDRLLTLNGTVVESWPEVPAMVRDNGDQPIDIQVERGGQTLPFTIQPRDARIGVAGIVERREFPLGLAAGAAMVSPILSIIVPLREFVERLTAPRTLMGPVAVIAGEPSPWALLIRLAELGSYAWPFSILIAFVTSRLGSARRLADLDRIF